MKLRISRGLLDGIVALASKTPGEEVCGLLLGLPPLAAAAPATAAGTIESFLPATNVAPDRARHFEIDPATLIRAHRAERDGGPAILGCFHSHPGGDPTPSAEDAAQAEANGALWLICAGPPWTASLWKAVTNGAVHGRFDPVPMIVDPGPSAP
ncbi:M67 family metallopeptidase [Sphingobium sufflavum]|uniref:Mov34/MPN/PAD-1 family protein n=1 Tax=Sphingobium sufflavum TaxID=1129547 RepID=UPI001F42FC97|nr:M67 family metallopeptidase [Sphingobium sufflavum]MCE7798497.1 M67 family metallopeptidase [Sphingobium sufflavum]